MSMDEGRANESGTGRGRRVLSALRVSGYNAFTAALFIGAGIVLQVTTGWHLSILLIVIGALQYAAAVVIRASGSGDVLRIAFFEPTDERDRDIRRRATALVGDIAVIGSLIALLVVLIVSEQQSALSIYLAWQTFALSVTWIVLTWIIARRH
ncbi:hypothetical protein [Brevibacterium album]|uniref:hypothetical protein n=1 Tax=Brevibacterium album TaxID=417948 RepID=UPI00048C2A2F|nr:hypothetical protein [Brevibacterium album]